MSSKGQHVQDNSVVERRLRPIYDWLDNGNNKKALQECDKVLKKTPNSHCAKALKAVTLHRMGKEQEAIAILDKLTDEKPTDDATLQAMTLCYRELQQLEKICKLYETAVKLDPNNEELFTHLFMSYARIFDFKAQQQAAMALFKHKPKTPYYCWAVMSLVLQATRGEGQNDPPKRTLLLSLAERMMTKLIVDNKLDAEQEVQLYVMILELQGRYEDVLRVLDGPLGAKLICTSPPLNKLNYLIKLRKWGDINVLCKSVLVESVDRWDIWKEYIKSVFELFKDFNLANNHDNHDGGGINAELDSVDDTPEKCHEFICRIVENGADNGFLLRGPYLARFELCSCLNIEHIDSIDLLGDTMELFIEYFRKFGHKPCCVSDLRIYLNLLDEQKKSELAQRLIEDIGVCAKTVPQSEQQMQRHLGALQLSRLCGAHRHLSVDHLKALVTAYSLHYQHGYEAYGSNLLSTDLGPSDPYAILAAYVLYDLSQKENSPKPIITALILLENLLKNSPSNFHAKLLCIKLYHTLGGTLGAQYWYNSLDTKHLQLESLGFVHCARLPTTGLFSLCVNLFDITLKFFSSNYKDSSDHLTFSYKYGSFLKLDEFMDFRERLHNSLLYTTVALDRMILSLVECSTVESIYSVEIELQDNKIDWNRLRDNSDLSVYISWDPERITDAPETSSYIMEFFHQNVAHLKLRSLLVSCLATAIATIKSMDGIRSKHIKHLQSLLVEWETHHQTCFDLNSPLRQDLLNLPLPSRLHQALEVPQIEIVGNLLKIFTNIALDELIDTINELCGNFEIAINQLPETIKCKINETNLLIQRETMEFIVNSVETLCISTVICSLCNDLIRPSNKKNKKKSNESKDILNKIVNMLMETINSLCDVLKDWGNVCECDDLSQMLESLNLYIDGKCVRDCINDSYIFAIKEIQNILKTKLKMLNSLIC